MAPVAAGLGDDFGTHPRQHPLHLELRRTNVARTRGRKRAVAGVDLLVGRRSLAIAEQSELGVGLGQDGLRPPQRGRDHREHQNPTAYEIP